MESLGLVVVVIAVAAGLIVWRLRTAARRGNAPTTDGQKDARDAPEPAPPTAAQDVSVIARVNALAAEAGEAFDDSDHPSEMLGQDPFNAAVRLMSARDNFSPEALVAYLGGHNMLLACMAGAALHRHPDGARVRRSVLDALARLGGWQYYFLLPYLAEAAPTSENLIGRLLVQMAPSLGYQINRGILAVFIRARHDLGETPRLGDGSAQLSGDNLDTLTRISHEG